MTRDRVRAVALAAIMVVSMVAVGAGFAGSAVAQDAGQGEVVVLDQNGEAIDASPFESVQAAVDAAGDDHTIHIGAGTYEGFVVDDVSGLTITAADDATPTVEGEIRIGDPSGGTGADGTVLRGLTIVDPDDSEDFAANNRGVGLASSDDVVIEGNTFEGFKTQVSLDFAGETPTNVTLTGNTFRDGFAAVGSTENVGDLTIEDNTFDNIVEGVGLGGGVDLTANNVSALIDANSFESLETETQYAVGDYRGDGLVKYAPTGNLLVQEGDSIQAAIDAAEPGSTIDVFPGTYETLAEDRDAYGDQHSFGLYVGTDDLTIRGVTAEGDPITNAENVQAEIISTTSASFDTNGPFIAADDATIQGIEITPNPDASPNKNVEVTGDNLSLESNVINGDIGSVYFATGDVQSLSVVGNHITAGLSFNNGVGNETGAESRIVEDNEIGLISFAGTQPDVNWRNYPVGPVTIEDNTIRGHSFVLEYEDEEGNTQTYVYEGVFSRVGSVTEATEFPELFDDNTVLRGSYIENDTEPTGVENLGTETSPAYEVAYSPQESINATTSGDTVVLTNGTYEENITLDTPNVTLRGAGSSVVDGRIDITEDAVAVEDLTVRHGAPSGSDEVEGIFVGDANGFGNTDEVVRIHNVTIEDLHPHGTEKTLEAIHVKQYEGNVDGVVVSETTLRNVTQPAAGANGIKLQAGVSDVSVTDSTITDIEGSWAYGVSATPSGPEDGVPTDVSLTSNAITNVSAINSDGIGVGVDGVDRDDDDVAESFADPTEIELSRNILTDNGIAVLNKNPDERLDATLNWWGDAAGPAESGTVVGNASYDPFLTVEPDEVNATSIDGTTKFGHDLVVPADGTPHSVAFPAPVEGNVTEVFGEFNGTVFAYDGDGWESGSEIADEEVGALDAFVVKVDEGEDDLRFDFEYTESDAQFPTSTDLEAGWNFVGAPESGDSDEAFEVTTTNIATVSHINAGAGSQPYGVGATATPPFATNPESVSPFQGYWVFVTDDGELGATVPVGPTQSNEEGALAGS